MSWVLVSYLIAVVASLGVGVPVLLRALRRGDVPLVLLGAALSIDGAEWLAWTLAVFSPAAGTPLGDALALASRLGVSANAMCLVAFTSMVFRPADAWSRQLGALLFAGLAVGLLGSGLAGDWLGLRNDQLWVWLELTAQTVSYAWAAVEPGRYYRAMRRRVAVGLTTPLVANRFLLWSVYAGLNCAAQIVYNTTLAFGWMVSGVDVFNVVFTSIAALALWLAVFPPRAYVRYLGSAPASAD